MYQLSQQLEMRAMSLESCNLSQDLAMQRYPRIMKRMMMTLMRMMMMMMLRRMRMMLMMRMTIVLIGKLGPAIS